MRSWELKGLGTEQQSIGDSRTVEPEFGQLTNQAPSPILLTIKIKTLSGASSLGICFSTP